MNFQNSYGVGMVKQDKELLCDVITIEKIEQIESKIALVDKDTLVVLDIDYTLTQPSYPAFQYGNFKANYEFVKNTMQLVSDKRSEFSTAIATSSEGVLIEMNAPLVIENLRKKGAKVLLLSAILTGEWANISDVMEWRVQNIKKIGIISDDFGIVGKLKFHNIQSYRENFPEISNGILLTNGELVTKAEVLNELLKKMQWKPKQIIFVDDSRKNIEEMRNYTSENGIDFFGYEYKGAKHGKYTTITKESFELEWNKIKEDVISN